MKDVGIAQDGKYRTYLEEPQPYLYLPHLQQYEGAMTLVVQLASSGQSSVTADPAIVITSLRREVAALDPSLPMSGMRTIEDFLQARTYFGPRLISQLLSIFGAIGLTLAVIGVYGVMSSSVAQQTHEIGIRMALGAIPGNVSGMVVKRGLWLLLIGIGLGLAGSFLSSRLLARQIWNVSPFDPIVGLQACAWPARRAARIDPITALRQE
jgi:putative ABC transport system permease protein